MNEIKPFRRILFYCCIIVFLFCLYLFLQAGSYDLLNPSLSQEKDVFVTYDDREAKGNSLSEVQAADGFLRVNFKPDSGAQYPYAGISFLLSQDYPFHVTDYNCISLSIKVDHDCKILLLFSQHSKEGQKLNILQHAEYLLSCTPGKESYSIPYSSFKIPDWWMKSNNLNGNIALDWEKINVFSIQNDPLMAEGTVQKFALFQISFENKVDWPLYAMLGVVLLITAVEVFIYKRIKKVQIQYVPVSADETDKQDPWDVLSHYLANHYREDIDLEQVYKETGIPKHKISSLIKEKTSLNFRQYINTIRIKEAERLFKTTNLSVTEIGYEVGYSSATQFNRVFKEIKRVAPSEYKRNS